MYQYSTSPEEGQEGLMLARLPSEDSDEDIDPAEYERQARERQRLLVEEAEARRKQWCSWTPHAKHTLPRERPPVIVRVDTPDDENAPLSPDEAERKEDMFSDSDDGDNFDETKRGDKLYMQFRNYSLSGYMDSKRFVALCYDTFLIPYDTNKPDFSLADAKAVFESVLSDFFDPELKICKEPVVNNCIPYDVFHSRLLLAIARKKDRSITDIISMLTSVNAANRRYWSAAEGPKQLLVVKEKLGNRVSSDDDEKGAGEQEKKSDEHSDGAEYINRK